MKAFEASTTIAAPPKRIWEVLTDTESWPQWDPYCDKIEGAIGLGAKIKAFTKLSPGRGFSVKVTELVDGERMTWTGGMPFGLFKGVRTFRLEPRGDEVVFTLREEFSGPLLKLIAGSLPDMTDAFESFTQGLKQRAEAS